MDKLTIEQLNDIAFLEKDIKHYEEQIKKAISKEEQFKYESRIIFNKSLIEKIKNPIKDDESYLLPEYRKNGYFNSEEFKKIEKEVDELIKELNIENTKEKNLTKKEILKEKYNIDWLSFEERFTKDSNVIIN